MPLQPVLRPQPAKVAEVSVGRGCNLNLKVRDGRAGPAELGLDLAKLQRRPPIRNQLFEISNDLLIAPVPALPRA